MGRKNEKERQGWYEDLYISIRNSGGNHSTFAIKIVRCD
jgi:hypothetical protein